MPNIDKTINIDKMFSKIIKTVQKSNGLKPTKESKPELGDKRDKEHLRKELTSTIPKGILEMLKNRKES